MQAHSHREYDGAVTREGDKKKEAAQVCCMSCTNNTHKQQQRNWPPKNKYVICHAMHIAVAHNAMHGAVKNTIHQEGSYMPCNAKMRRHEERNENRTGKEDQQEVTPNECLYPPPHT